MHLTLQTATQAQPVQNFQPTYGPSIWENMGDALHQSVMRVLSLLISLLPGLLALLLAVAMLAAVGLLLSYIVRRILTSIRFDDRLAGNQSSGIADWSPSHSPTILVARTVPLGLRSARPGHRNLRVQRLLFGRFADAVLLPALPHPFGRRHPAPVRWQPHRPLPRSLRPHRRRQPEAAVRPLPLGRR